MLQGQLAQRTIDVVADINKAVKTLAHCADLKWMYFKIPDKLQDVVRGVASDVAWANRPDLGSQGGWMAWIANDAPCTQDYTIMRLEISTQNLHWAL